jgi:hypothetical protein
MTEIPRRPRRRSWRGPEPPSPMLSSGTLGCAPRIGCLAVVAGLFGGATGAGAAHISAPRSAARGAPLSIAISGLAPTRSHRVTYRLTFAPLGTGRTGAKRSCVRDIGTGYSVASATRVLHFTGRVPSTLVCYAGRGGRRLGLTKVTPGTYALVIGVKTGKASWSPHATLQRRKITVRSRSASARAMTSRRSSTRRRATSGRRATARSIPSSSAWRSRASCADDRSHQAAAPAPSTS